MQQRQLEEALSWRLVTELWRRFPDLYRLIETHPGGGQYDCLSLIEFDGSFHTIFDVNRGGSSHVHQGRSPHSWPDWVERMLSEPRHFLDEISDAIGMDVPTKLPASTPATLSFRFICEFLTHAVGRTESWECRNGFCDTSGYGGGEQEDWFASFPAVHKEHAERELGDGRLPPAYGYWFLLKSGEPLLCIDVGGQLWKQCGQMHDLAALYSTHKRMWPVIAESALELLP